MQDQTNPSPAPKTVLSAGSGMRAFAMPDAPGKALLTRAAEATGLTARGWTRTLGLARTIADLDGSEAVRRLHIDGRVGGPAPRPSSVFGEIWPRSGRGATPACG